MTQRKRKVIAPKEWDFREVHEDEFYAASEYEYARELVSPAQARKARKLLNEFGKIVHKEFHVAYPSMDDVPRPLMFFAQEFPALPRAWLKLTDKTRAKYVKKSGRRGGQVIDHLWPALSVLNHPAESDPEMPAEEMGRLMQSGKLSNDRYGIYGFFPIQINWDWSNKEIIKSLSSWVKHTRPAGVKEVTLRGKVTVPNDASRLKWLSAYRLQRAGWSFKKAKTKFEDYLSGRDPASDPPPTLPYYKYLSGWDGAIQKAKKLIRKIEHKSL